MNDDRLKTMKRARSGCWVSLAAAADAENGVKSKTARTARTFYQEGQDNSFSPLDTNGNGTVSSFFFIDFLLKSGLDIHRDPRLAAVLAALTKLGAVDKDTSITFADLEECTVSCRNLIRKCVAGQFRVPDFPAFTKIFRTVFEEVLPEMGGATADYIPELANVDPEQFGIAVCTVHGQCFSIGDSKTSFGVQSCCKPMTYLLAERSFGHEYVHEYVGHEPSGQRFNQMVLKDAPKSDMKLRQVPHNPLINAGAILCTSMVDAHERDQDKRLQNILAAWREISGYPSQHTPGCPIGFDEAVYQSESSTADRNWCLGYMMKEKKSFPPCFKSLKDTLEMYFKTCSITSNCEAMASMAATMANGGLSPMTGERVFSAESVRRVLPIMLTCGMYDYSGEWAYQIGVPSKSGVAGCVFMVVPNVCGIAVWSPRLDEIGNSVRGVLAAKRLASYITFHNFEIFTHMRSAKINPIEPKDASKQKLLGEVVFAASVGDVRAMQNWKNAGVDLYMKDYDHRTALHLAATEGKKDVVAFLIENAPPEQRESVVTARDRWGGTPLDEAKHGGHADCVELLQRAGGTHGSSAHLSVRVGDDKQPQQEADIVPAIFAAARGDLMELIQINASGRCRDIFVGDYDFRTALHLAAAEGHAHIVKYMLAQIPLERKMTVLGYVDRYGGTPHDDAERASQTECATLLRDAELGF